MKIADFNRDVFDKFKNGDVIQVQEDDASWKDCKFNRPEDVCEQFRRQCEYRIKPREDENTMTAMFEKNRVEDIAGSISNAKTQFKARFGVDVEITVKEKQREDGLYYVVSPDGGNFFVEVFGVETVVYVLRHRGEDVPENSTWFSRIEDYK